MNHTTQLSHKATGARRKGVVTVLTAFGLIALVGFLALGIDVGYIAYEKQKMQIACDAAALAAAMEITHAIEEADSEVGDATEYALNQAKQMAEYVALLNGQFVDPTVDVKFGRRSYNSNTELFEIEWDQTPSNVIKVICRKDNPDNTAPDARVPTFFAHLLGNSAPDLEVSAIATVESRDIVSVLDFSRSMNFDSYFASEALTTTLSQSQIEENLLKVWNDLGDPSYGNMPYTPTWVTIPSANWGDDLTVRWESEAVYVECASDLNRVKLWFSNGQTQTFNTSSSSGYWQGTGSKSGNRITKCQCRRGSTSETFDFYSNSHIRRGLGLNDVAYPWPDGSWDQYISMARDTSGSYYDSEIYNNGYRRKFGTMTFLHYIMRFKPAYSQTPDLWRTRHYPFQSLKSGQEMLCDYLEDLSFNDYVGMVSYDTNHRVEKTMSGTNMPTVDISANPITNDYQAIHNLIHYKQAAHYTYATNMGGGLKDAKTLLDEHGRPGARGTVLLITDGNANTRDSGESTSLPSDWDWDELFDYDNDGEGDYYIDDSHRKYVLKKAKECVDAGYTIHTMSVGADADTDLMEAVAHLGKGVYIQVPAGTTTSEMEAAVVDAFRQIAALVPSARMLDPEQ